MPRISHQLGIAAATLLTFVSGAKLFALEPAEKEEWMILFNGRDLSGWTPKISKHKYGENFGNTFRVEDGLIKVRYDQYGGFDGQFGHLFYEAPFSHYRLIVEYRFVGDQADGNPGAWALRNSGAMLHSPHPSTMLHDQSFPISIEAQFLGGNGDGKPRSTANMCSPATDVVYDGRIYPEHCLSSTSPTFHGDQWVRAEIVVLGAGPITHYVNGERVLDYSLPQYGGGTDAEYKAAGVRAGALIDSGFISLQSESHPIDFRRVELLNLAGCMDKNAQNFKRYFVKSEPATCVFSSRQR